MLNMKQKRKMKMLKKRESPPKLNVDWLSQEEKR